MFIGWHEGSQRLLVCPEAVTRDSIPEFLLDNNYAYNALEVASWKFWEATESFSFEVHIDYKAYYD